ncbi:hypothetical protein SLS63_004974 [Diaporthe eres]|uniref:chitinase n=1 Tax=Diaporthe eres TaxID=83184 RepID=A0ABR1PD11_DIAER
MSKSCFVSFNRGDHRQYRLTLFGRPFDYSAKVRREYQLPQCHVQDVPSGTGDSNTEALSATSMSSLLGRASEDDFTCAPDRPCANKACCPRKTLQCNYGEDACGTSGVSPNEVCWSNCDAKSECGKNAQEPGQECPLNVCCGKWGFCGMTKDFCDPKDHGATGGCQSNCEQPGPKHKADAQDRIIGYYEAWRFQTDCQGMGLDDIPVNSLTHLYFSFASITPGDYSITGMKGDDQNLPEWLFTNFTALKQKNPALKTVIAIGGWTFNDPGPTQTVFSTMVSSAETRKAFIDNLMSFLREYSLDGVDFDWEYPGADDRGGVETDGANFVKFLKELDDANNKQPIKYVVSFTAPTSYWYLQKFDLKAVNYVDFVNVMSYDLHGIWDGHNPIGWHIYGHTNLTEMRSAFDLFWRNDVPANKVNMGLGFYGRAFQLEDPACSKPGCNFKGGATKGGCSGESGILSYREIMDIVDQKKLKPVHDKKAGVKYITWNRDQWASYDDADTFAQKKDLAKDLGLGGYLIWAIDQDDSSLSALQAVIAPKKLGDLGMKGSKDDWQSSNKHCYVTACDGNCDAGDIKIEDQKCGDKNKRSKLCCPLSGAPDPKDCTWRGNPGLCNGHCHDDEVMMEMNKWGGDDKGCSDGKKAYCCKSPLAQENSCYWAGVGASCHGDDLPLTFSGTVLDILEDVAKVILRLVGRPMPLVALTGEALLLVLDELHLDTQKRYCCPKGDIDKWKNCEWFGKPGTCFDGHCPDMTYAQLTDSYFGGGETCGGQLSRVRTFCCEAKDEPLFLPVPLENLFADPPSGDSVDTDFTLETDKSSDSQQDPNDAAFQFVVLASPEELQVSLDKRDGSHWDVFGCLDGETEGEHTVQMVCTDVSDDSNCHRIGLGHGVPGTIIQMPKGCGPGKYAVAKDMVPSKSNILPRHLAHLANRTPVVYDLTFDYDFARVPRDLGDTQMRVDFSNQDDYWDTVVAGAATTKKKAKRSLGDVGGNHVRWLEEEFRDDFHFGALSRRDLEERWFGSNILAWLAQLVKPEIKREFTYKYEETLTAKLIDETWSCAKGDVGYEGHLLAQALLKVQIETSFGFTLIVTKLTPESLDLSQSYLTFYNKGDITGVLTLEAVARVFFDKRDVILNIPFPGASFKIPGIATIGPQLTVEGSIDASLALAGKIETRLQFAKWEVRQIVPDNNDDTYKPKEIGDGDTDLKDNGKMNGLKKPEFYAGFQVSGDVTAKISAAAEFGVRFDKRWHVDPAAVAVVGEASVMIKMASGISTEGAPSTFKWPGAEYKITDDYLMEVVNGSTCPDLGPIPTRRDLDAPNHLELTADTSLLASNLHARSLEKRAAVWGPVLSVPVGSYFCPRSTDDNENGGTPCANIKPAPFLEDYSDTVDAEGGDGSSDVFSDSTRGREVSDEEAWWAAPNNKTSSLPDPSVRATKDGSICDFPLKLQYPGAKQVPNAPAYGFRQPDVCENLDFGTPLPGRVITTPPTQYDSEHVLEVQLLKQFFSDLDKSLKKVPHPDPSNTNMLSFCELVMEQWNIPGVVIKNLENGKGKDNALTPADHVAQQYPTTKFNKHEFIVLEHEINTPTKNNAWGGKNKDGTQKLIINTGKWLELLNTADGVKSILRSLRLLIGSRMYQNDAHIRDTMNRQKNRVGKVLNILDTDTVPKNPRRTTAGYRAWTPLAQRPEWNPQLSLQDRWDRFVSTQFVEMQSKTMGVLNEWLPRVQKEWADDFTRKLANQDDADLSDQDKAERATLQEIIDIIDATTDVFNLLPPWLSPF